MPESNEMPVDASFEDRMGHAQEVMQSELGDQQFLAMVPGTGWKDVPFKRRDEIPCEIPYPELWVPGADHVVEGHNKSLQIGEINGRDALLVGRVHANEDPRAQDVQKAMLLIVEAIKNNLDGMIVTNAAGGLHGRINADRGLVRSLIDTAIADALGSALRGRKKERIDVGDVAVIDQIGTISLGGNTPLGAAGFVDWSSADAEQGLHGFGNFIFEMTRRAVESAQAGRAPRANYYYFPGPQFEGPWDKRILRALGADAVGMSSIQSILAATKAKVPVSGVTFITNPAFGAHSHESNLAIADANAPKMGRVIENLADRWPTREQIERLFLPQKEDIEA
ncbi:hypothetical protein HN709_01830 [Candidatus Peregrinibacteria bacterium]|jgi:purine-nucleoside phosphorylase|nr:hypothetical protein [Candidatus Peregrinibacteria bacterium]MBT7736403.1 hypothetical protein [Candidatus Peregrinibacteria bacterium]